jgi:GTP-binding protein EngB required for normal cell division
VDLRDYEHHKFKIAELLRSGLAIAPEDQGAWKDRLQDLFARLAEDRFNLVVVGRFSRGKTSLMNAILGTDRLPTGIVPLTSVITTVGYGPKERVVLTFNERILNREIPIDSLPEYVTQHGNPGNVQRIKMAEIQLPIELLRRGFYFVDTPGLGSAIQENTQTTETFLPEADAFVLVSSYESPLSEEELRFFRMASSSARRVFIVLNKHDTVAEDERKEAISYVHDQLRSALPAPVPTLFSVSARDAIDAERKQDAASLVASGIPAFEEVLIRFLLAEKRNELLLRMCDRAAHLIRELPPGPEPSTLVSRLHELSKKISEDIGQRCTDTSEGTASPGSSQIAPCEVCAHIAEVQWQFLCQYQYNLTISSIEQQSFASRGGFCGYHTWQYDRVASAYGISTGYPELLEQSARRLRDAVREDAGESLAGKDYCIFCEVHERAEAEIIAKVSARLATDPEKALKSLSAICIPHLGMLLETIDEQELRAKLRERQASILEGVAEDMRRYALKRDGLRRVLTNDDETGAAYRALLLLAAHPNIRSPRRS